jgi:DNA-binding NtrC family response regulator
MMNRTGALFGFEMRVTANNRQEHDMKVLIVESDPNLGLIWKRHLKRFGHAVDLAYSQDGAVLALQKIAVDMVILNLVLDHGSAFAVSDIVSYRYPKAKVIFVTDTSFFSDGSIFKLAPNACAFLRTQTPPEDLAAMVEHFGSAAMMQPTPAKHAPVPI